MATQSPARGAAFLAGVSYGAAHEWTDARSSVVTYPKEQSRYLDQEGFGEYSKRDSRTPSDEAPGYQNVSPYGAWLGTWRWRLVR